MQTIIIKILPSLFLFALGIGLRKLGFWKRDHGTLFLKMVFYLAIPALVIQSMATVPLSRESIWLPVISTIVILSGLLLAWLASYFLHMDNRTQGAFFIAAMILNTSFVLPFISAVKNDAGLQAAIIFDFANGMIAVTLAYTLACRFGKFGSDHRVIIKRVLLAPPLWALVIGLLINLMHWEIPGTVQPIVHSLSVLAFPLILFSMGIYFTPRIHRLPLVITVLLIRNVGGLFLGLLFATLFGLEGVARSVVIVVSAAPVGFSVLTFAAMTDLNIEFAASAASFSIGLSAICLPIFLWIF